MFLFNMITNLVGGWGVFTVQTVSYNSTSFTPVGIANTYGCSHNESSSSSAGTCTPPTPNGGWLGTLIQGFGDWIDSTYLFIQAFAVTVFLPGWYLLNYFHVPLPWVLAFSGAMYILYASFISYFFGFRSPEANT